MEILNITLGTEAATCILKQSGEKIAEDHIESTICHQRPYIADALFAVKTFQDLLRCAKGDIELYEVYGNMNMNLARSIASKIGCSVGQSLIPISPIPDLGAVIGGAIANLAFDLFVAWWQ